MSNIFELAYISGEEDYFTATLEYLIDNIPEIGQAIVYALFAGSDQSVPKFIQVLDHPALSTTDRPDFLIECDRVDVLCEHKLDSDLGNQQLERYLKLAEQLSHQNQKPTLLALISNRFHSIPMFIDRSLTFTLDQKPAFDLSTSPVTAKSQRSYFRCRQLASIQQRSPIN